MKRPQTSLTRALPWLVASAVGAGVYGVLRAQSAWKRQQLKRQRSDVGPRIVILGAGFAGLTAAQKLCERLKGACHITLVDRHNYHLFTPMLYQAAALGIVPNDATYPVRQFTGRHGIMFQRGMVTGIDLAQRRVALDTGDLPYDYLVIALGSATNFFGNTGAQQHALPLKWLEDGIAIRYQVIDMAEQATLIADPATRRELMTFVVVGGGATGVETAGALADLLQHLIPEDYPQLDPSELRVLLIESEPKLLGHMNDRMAAIALDQLRKMGVEVWISTRVKDVASDHVVTEDGRTVPTRTAIWTTGVRAPDVVAGLDLPHGKGGSLLVDDYLQVQGHQGVFAVGDNAHSEDQKTHEPVPLLAASAMQEGAAVAENIARVIEQQPLVPFHYLSLGNVVALGRTTGVAEVGGVVVGGLAGWLAWRAVHLVKITSFRSKLATLVDWSVGLYEQDSSRFDMQPVASPSDRT